MTRIGAPGALGGTMRRHAWALAALAVAAAVVAGGKQYYRAASADELGWILAPTARLVSAVTGGHFVYEAGVGWVDRAATFIIAPACAGLNFAMAAFLALTLGWLGGMRTLGGTAARLGAAAALAYGATLVVNTARIALAIALHNGTIDLGDFDRAEVHRVEGIVVYLGGLCVLYALARAIASRGVAMPWLVDRRLRWRWMAVPMAAYLVITLGLPLAHGAAFRGGFVHHATWVLAGCLLIAAAALIGGIALELVRATIGRLRHPGGRS